MTVGNRQNVLCVGTHCTVDDSIVDAPAILITAVVRRFGTVFKSDRLRETKVLRRLELCCCNIYRRNVPRWFSEEILDIPYRDQAAATYIPDGTNSCKSSIERSSKYKYKTLNNHR